MKCNHKKVTTPFCPVCGVRVRPEGVKSEILDYMREHADKVTNKLNSDSEYHKFRVKENRAHLDRWNRWIEWLLKQENNP